MNLLSFTLHVVLLWDPVGRSSFRGFILQARTLADETPVGSFAVFDGPVKLSSCSPPDVRHLDQPYFLTTRMDRVLP